jgi:hypothetical protein
MGNSGVNPKRASESCFVADEDFGRHSIVASGQIVTMSIPTTRYVGSVDEEGNLTEYLQHFDQKSLAKKLVLTIRARIDAIDAGGRLGDEVKVEVFINNNAGSGGDGLGSLGNLEGDFGFGFGPGSGWQLFKLDVGVWDVRFPADPCGAQSSSAPCGREPEPRPNEISFEFTGDIHPSMRITLEVDWLTLEPKFDPGLAWRPVLLVHDLGGQAADMLGEAAWAWQLARWDMAFHAVDLTPAGTIRGNGAEITAAVADLKKRFGVDRIHIVGHGKGGIDAREHVRRHDDVETLFMIGTPNEGSFMADLAALMGAHEPIPDGKFEYAHDEMTQPAMINYNRSRGRNSQTGYVTFAGHAFTAHSVKFARFSGVGTNDEVVSVASVHAVTEDPIDVFDSTDDPVSSYCADAGLSHHSCLRYYLDSMDPYALTRYLAVLTAPPSGRANTAAHPVGDDTAAGVQAAASATALAPADGVTQSHTVLIDPVDTALFYVFVEGNVLRLELISPTGRRIDTATPLTDPAVVHSPLRDTGPFSFTGYQIQEPETGTWTLEVTGTAAPPPDLAYGVTALVQLPPGAGVFLTAGLDTEQCVAGDPVTITAAVTADGVPVTGASVQAQVLHPDGATTTVVLADDGTGGDAVASDGQYTGVFTTALTGLYTVVVAAEAAAPAVTREQLLQVSVAPSGTAFSGTISDHGLDTDADGRYDHLVIDVGIDVDVAADYRVFGTLTDGAATTIEQVRIEQQLQPGPQTIPLTFDGALLFNLGHDGPYLLNDLVIEDVATATGLALGPAYTTATYTHTDFQRPPLLLTGHTSDHGAHAEHMDRLPYETLVIEVEVDTTVAVDVEAVAKLYAEDGTFIATWSAVSSLVPGLGVVEFSFPAFHIFRAGKPGPYTLQLFSMWGTTTDGAPVSLSADDIVAVTQPYRLEDFAESPRYTVGGTVAGLIGFGQLELEITAQGPSGSPTARLQPRNGPFTFSFHELVSGNSYQVRITTHPTNPVQICTVANASGTIEDANVTDVTVQCS